MKKHDLHIVINSIIKNKIINFAEQLNKNISETLTFIVINMIDYLEEKQFNLMDTDNEYPNVNADCDLHIYMEKTNYRFIKQTHGNLNYYSMAVLVREMIDLFIKGVHKYGLSEYVKIIQDCKITKKQFSKKICLPQLSPIIPIEPYYRLLFSKKHELIGVELNN